MSKTGTTVTRAWSALCRNTSGYVFAVFVLIYAYRVYRDAAKLYPNAQRPKDNGAVS